MDVLALLVLLASVLWLDPEGVGAEVITLCLEEVGREVLCAVSVVEAESSAESRSGDTPEGALGDNATKLSVSIVDQDKGLLLSPSCLCLVNSLVEEVVEQQVLELGVGTVGLGDVLQENGADNAASTPHEGDFRLVQLPAVLLGSLRKC